MLAPSLQGVWRYAEQYSASALADGVASSVNSLRPGLTVVLVAPRAFQQGRVEFAGGSIVVVSGPVVAVRDSRWPLPNVTLAEGVAYMLTLVGGEVEVGPVV